MVKIKETRNRVYVSTFFLNNHRAQMIKNNVALSCNPAQRPQTHMNKLMVVNWEQLGAGLFGASIPAHSALSRCFNNITRWAVALTTSVWIPHRHIYTWPINPGTNNVYNNNNNNNIIRIHTWSVCVQRFDCVAWFSPMAAFGGGDLCKWMPWTQFGRKETWGLFPC